MRDGPAEIYGVPMNYGADNLRIPTKPAMHSNLKPAGYSDLKPATLGVIRMGLRDGVLRFGEGQAAGWAMVLCLVFRRLSPLRSMR